MEGAVAEEEVDDVAFVGLEPIEGDCFDGAEVEAVDVDGVEEFLRELLIVRQRGADECRADRFEHVFLRAIDNDDEGEHIFGADDFRFGAGAVDDGGAEVIAAFLLDESGAAAIFVGDLGDACGFATGVDLIIDGFGDS